MSNAKNKVKLFEGQKVRAVWDEEAEKWWFSVLDIIGILTDQPDYQKVKNYWKWLKNKLKNEGSQLVSNTNQLKIEAADGKKYLTDAADTEQVLRLVQSIPSKKAEPFKLWLAKTGSERIDETIDPELSIDRATLREKRLSFEVTTEADPFYSESNLAHLRRGVYALNSGKGIEHDIIL